MAARVWTARVWHDEADRAGVNQLRILCDDRIVYSDTTSAPIDLTDNRLLELLRAANLGERLLEHALPLRRVVELIEDVDDEEQAAVDLLFDITVYDRTKKRDVLVDVIRGG